VKKILVIHNNYKSIGGEDIAVQSEISFLKKHYEVETLFFQNDNKNILAILISLLFGSNFQSNKKLEYAISNFKPDLAYVHNTWFKASLGIFKILNKNDITTFIKLHNFRYYCTKNYFSSKHLGNKKICEACGLTRKSLGYFNKYFQESFFKSFAVNRYGKKYIKILKNNNNKILVLTEFHRNFLINLGINQNKIFTYPNYINFNDTNNVTNKGLDNYIIYAGRISEEKGVSELIKTFIEVNIPNFKLKIVGDGPILKRLMKTYEDNSNFIEFTGEKSNKEVLKLILNSRAVVTATKLYEGQPTLLCEASAMGIPSIFPRTGGIKEFFPDNYPLSFEQFNYEDLKEKLQSLEDKNKLTSIGKTNKDFLKKIINKNNLKYSFENIYD
tara:strand:- start:75 stop:1232 length:1158 start_codon:yes stop_codon:yes gene_type:complete